MGLAVGNDFFVLGDPEVFEDLRHVRADAQLTGLVHACGPFEVDRAGDVPGLGGQHFLAGIFQRPARVPDRQIFGAEAALQVFARGGRLFVQGQCQRPTDNWRNLDRHRHAIRQPRWKTTVYIVVLVVTDHVEQPDKASGPAAAFVVIDHVDRVFAVAQFTE
jgi:hypothetical protein